MPYGKPRTEEERRARHKARFGTSKLPPRGTGLNKYEEIRKKAIARGAPEGFVPFDHREPRTGRLKGLRKRLKELKKI